MANMPTQGHLTIDVQHLQLHAPTLKCDAGTSDYPLQTASGIG